MNALIILGIILTLSYQNIAKKAYNEKTGRKGTFIFSAISTLSALIIFLISPDINLFAEPGIIPYSLGFSLSYFAASFFSVMAISCGSLAITSLILSYSLIIPTIYGVLFLGEPTSVWLFLGIALLMVSLFLSNAKKDKDAKFSVKWVIYLVISFVGNGACTVVQRLEQIKFNGQYKNEFMIIALAVLSVALILVALIKERKEIRVCLKPSVFALTNGLANGLTNLLVMLIALSLPASVTFPLISSGSIIATVIVSILLYKEKLSTNQKIAVLLGVGAIICLNI